MCQPIRGQGGHIGFRILLNSNNTWSEPHQEHLWQVWSRSLQPFLRRSSKCEKLTDGRRTTDAAPWHKLNWAMLRRANKNDTDRLIIYSPKELHIDETDCSQILYSSRKRIVLRFYSTHLKEVKTRHQTGCSRFVRELFKKFCKCLASIDISV